MINLQKTEQKSISPKNKSITLLLCIFFGSAGIHRFYTGKIGTGILYLMTFGLFGIGWLVDIIRIIFNNFDDKNKALIVSEKQQMQAGIFPNKKRNGIYKTAIVIAWLVCLVISICNISKNSKNMPEPTEDAVLIATVTPIAATETPLIPTVEPTQAPELTPVPTVYIEEKVTLYSADGSTMSVGISEAEAYKNVGWYTEPVVIMYAADGRTSVVPQSEVDANKNVGWYTKPVVTMYAADGRTSVVPQSEVDANKNVGWFTEPVITMYAADGRTSVVPQSEVDANKNVGWYTEPVVTMYAADGRTSVVPQSEVDANKNVGWFTEPVITMYAADGRTSVVPQSEIEANEKVGWYKTQAEAAKSNNTSNKSDSSGAGNKRSSSSANNTASTVDTNDEIVYIGHKGNKYHNKNCRTLKNGAIPISLKEAKAQGRDACKVCH